MIKYSCMLKIHMKLNINFIKKTESTGLKHINNPKALIGYSNDMQDVYKNIEEYNIGKKVKY